MGKKPEQNCGNCRWWNASIDKRGRRLKRGYSYVCNAPFPEMPILPICITKDTGWEPWLWPPKRKFTDATAGKDCPCWQIMGERPTAQPEGNGND